MKQNCIVTVANNKWIHRAFVMAESALTYNPNCDIIILVPDLTHEKIGNAIWPVSNSVRIIGLDEIENQALQNMHTYFNVFELCCAAKSFLIEHVLFKMGYTKVVLLDPDIMCYSSLNEVWSILEHTDMAATPHVTAPIPVDGHVPDAEIIAQYVGSQKLRHT